MMRLMLAPILALLVLAAPATAQPPGFPHDEHRGMFPLCTSCHVVAEASTMYPAPASCTECHDGERRERVAWDAPDRRASLLAFDHVEHQEEAAGEGLECESCHAPEGRDRMSVIRADAPQCLDCHAHEARAHLVDAECSTCHRPLAASSLPVDRIAGLPAPPDHAAADFLLDHEGGTECQYCHTRQRCVSCHVNAAVLEPIAAVPEAPASMDLPSWAAHYPEPPSHEDPRWLRVHGTLASAAECSTCHTRDDCAACHAAARPAPIGDLPAARDVQAPGVRIARMVPATHEVVRFERNHGAIAEVETTSCEACHARTQCVECHDAARRPSFHPENYVERHATAAWARRLECANCHEVSVFCAECHSSSGFTPETAGEAKYHDNEPVWLLRHGQAARQSLESCTSCHRQQSCLRCHSELGAFRVNPHGPDFDAERARSRNPLVCRACHVRDPIGGGAP